MSTPAARLVSYDVPIALDSPPSPATRLDSTSVRSRNLKNAASLRSRTLGPMPVQEFINYFLPTRYHGDTSKILSSCYAFRSIPCAESVSATCEALVIALNRHSKHKSRCPGYVFEVAATPDGVATDPGGSKPHIFCYASDNLDRARPSDASPRVEFGYAELFIEVQPDPSDHDCFADPPVSSDDNARATYDLWARRQADGEEPSPREAFGLHVAYVAEVFARQHRTCLFSIAMFPSCARIFRWERSGCVVTELFDIREHPNLLCEFLWRVSQVPHVFRGHDIAVEAARLQEEETFRNVVTAYVQSQLEIEVEDFGELVKTHYEPGRVFAVHILPQHFSSHPENIRRFVVSRPVVSPPALIGRGTRGYWALDTSTRQVVFLKDTWRFLDCEELEGDTISRASVEPMHPVGWVILGRMHRSNADASVGVSASS